ncbi:glycine cleavage system protein H [Pedobacter sp. HDW13]|uniref:VanZ family protein n=1 Tax=unclassified Pedobacter TaxID=2628915 RepID=UPI000F5998E3|nr:MULTISPECIES: VanZ family protein [unclassified Pedobacter]QIL39164.1 glycine cleavage system protein H [Pedobacter sp. HDW13]RQO69344.1 glycine cleavage system protein H [Pedobacter sp. KBW01]
MYKALKRQVWAIIWTVVILVLCNMRMPESSGPGFFFEGFDKMAHLGFFFVLSVLLFYGKIRYQHTFAFRTLTIFKILLINAIIGGAIEILQWKVFTYRSAEWWDFACDMLGALMAVFSYVLLHKLNFNENES